MIPRWRRVLGLAAVLGLVAASSSGGHARAQELPATAIDSAAENAFSGISYDVGESLVSVRLVALGPVGEARVRTEPGFVRVWFPAMTGWGALDLEGDGSAVRFVRVRQGAGDTGVVIIRLGDRRTVPSSAVTVQTEASRATISIARSALPEPAPLEGISAPEAPVAGAAVVSETAPLPVAPTLSAVSEGDPEPVIAEPVPSGAPSRSAAVLLAQHDEPAPTASAGLGAAEGGGSGTLWTLLSTTALLALALAAVRYWQTRTPSGGAPSGIRVLSAVRLSQKQQLVVVRALGQDHLLAIEPGRTERLASVSSPETSNDDDSVLELRLSGSAETSASSAPGGVGLGLAPTLFGRTVAALAAAHTTARPGSVLPPAPAASESVRRIDGTAPLDPSSSIRPGSPGGAVAGLVRLRAHAGARP